MFFRKIFLFYLPIPDKYIVIKARDEATAVWKLCYNYRFKVHNITNYEIIKNCETL